MCRQCLLSLRKVFTLCETFSKAKMQNTNDDKITPHPLMEEKTDKV